MEKIEVKKLAFEYLTSSRGSVKINDVSINEASFKDCIISSFYWNNVEFKNEPEIIRCDLSSLKMSNVKWKKKLLNSYLDKKIRPFYRLRLRVLGRNGYSQEEISNLKYERDTYRQLKVASFASHNQIDALLFYKNEMLLYWKQIRIEGGITFQDKILIFLSRWISNFGQSWIMPLIWLGIIHFIFMMCLFSWNCDFSLTHDTVKFGFWGEYFQLINPIHKLPDYVNTNSDKITDFFMRVLGGYFIYHFIKASRKFLEK